MSKKRPIEYEIDFDTLIELASQDMTKSQYESYLDYISGVVDDELCSFDEDEDDEDD